MAEMTEESNPEVRVAVGLSYSMCSGFPMSQNSPVPVRAFQLILGMSP